MALKCNSLYVINHWLLLCCFSPDVNSNSTWLLCLILFSCGQCIEYKWHFFLRVSAIAQKVFKLSHFSWKSVNDMGHNYSEDKYYSTADTNNGKYMWPLLTGAWCWQVLAVDRCLMLTSDGCWQVPDVDMCWMLTGSWCWQCWMLTGAWCWLVLDVDRCLMLTGVWCW